MRLAVWIIYGVALLLGTAYLSLQRSVLPGDFIAARELTANRLLQPGDVALSPDGRMYLNKSVGKGARLSAADFSSSPAITTTKGLLPVAVPAARTDVISGAINAGEKVRICPSDDKDLEMLEVETVLCGSGDGECVAIIGVPESKVAAVAKLLKPPGGISLKPAPADGKTDGC